MPRYKCHKIVHALKIKSIEREQMPLFANATCRGSFVLGSACGHCERCDWERSHGPAMGITMIPEDPRYGHIRLEPNWVAKFNPEAGGYLVVYEDGYKSFSPAKAFEEGYTRIPC